MDFDTAAPFLSAHRRGVLATIRSSGVPQMSTVAYATIDREIWISVTESRAKTANARRDPRVALHVASDDFGRWVVVEGTARLTAVATSLADTVVADLRRLYEAVAGPHPDWDDFDRAMIDDARLVIKIEPSHLYGQI